MNFVKAYHQIPVKESFICKTAITNPFELHNASPTFKRYMDTLFRDLPFMCVYIDDILISSSSHDQHMAYLRQVLQSLSKHNIKILAKKSVLAAAEVSFLGYTISSKSICPEQFHSERLLPIRRHQHLLNCASLLVGWATIVVSSITLLTRHVHCRII